MSEKRGRRFGSGSLGGALGHIERLTRLGRAMRRKGVGGLVRDVLSGQSTRTEETGFDSSHREQSGSEEETTGREMGDVTDDREAELNREAEGLRKALEQAKLDLLGQTTKLKNEIFDLKKRNSELLEQVVQLTKRERDLSKQILDVQFQGSGHKADKKKLEIEVRDLKRALKEAEQKLKESQASGGQRIPGQEPAQTQDGQYGSKPLDAGGQTIQEDPGTVAHLEDELARLRLDVKERDERLVDLEHRLEKTQMRLEDLRKSLGDRESKIRSLDKEKARLLKQLAASRAENQGLVRELDRMRRVTARTTEERRRLREVSRTSQIETLQSAVAELQSAVIELRDVVDEGVLAVAERPNIDEETSGERIP